MAESSTVGAKAGARAAEVLPQGRPAWAGHLRVLLVLLAGGAVLGLVWHTVMAGGARASDPGEVEASGDVGLALLSAAAGVLTGAALLRHRRQLTATRIVVAVLGSGLGSLLAVGVARTLGPARVGATGVLVIWPLIAAGMISVVSIAFALFTAEDD